MDTDEPIIIRRGGFLSALAYGFFGTVCVVLICGAAITLYGMKMFDDQLSEIMTVSPKMAETLLQWQDALPPAVADTLDDQRSPEYVKQIDTSVELVRDFRNSFQYPVIEVTNRGDSLITLMSLRVVVEDGQGMPVHEITTHAATPITIEDDWRGPILPGSKRRFRTEHLHSGEEGLQVSVEVSDLRIWNKHHKTARDVDSELITDIEQPSDFVEDLELPEFKTIPIEDSLLPNDNILSDESTDISPLEEANQEESNTEEATSSEDTAGESEAPEDSASETETATEAKEPKSSASTEDAASD